jgi:hypothetical protein
MIQTNGTNRHLMLETILLIPGAKQHLGPVEASLEP